MLSPPSLISSPRDIHFMFDSLTAKSLVRSVPQQLLCLRRTSLSLRTSSPTMFSVNPYLVLLILQIWITMQHFVKMGYTFITVQTLCIIPLSLQTIRPGAFLSNAHAPTLTLSSPCPLTGSLYASCMPHLVVRLFQRSYVRYATVTYRRFPDSPLPCSASTNQTYRHGSP